MIDIVLPLGPGSPFGNQELRYALRSIWRFARAWRKVYITGIDPGFLNKKSDRLIHRLTPEAEGNKEFKIAAKFLRAAEDDELTDYIVKWNDDYILTREIDVRKIDFHHRGLLLDATQSRGAGTYRDSLLFTHKKLIQAGRRAYHYDIHAPMIYNRQLFRELSSWWEVSRRSACGLVVKSTYANNVLQAPGKKMSDLKITNAADIESIRERIRNRWVFSYSDGGFKSGLNQELARLYPDPCPLEREG